MSDERELLRRTAEIAANFLDTLEERRVRPEAGVDQLRSALGGLLPDGPSDPLSVVEALADAAEPGVVGIPSGRYFGFVIGGALPAALAADWLTSTWDRNAGLVVGGPSAAVVEEVAGTWLKDLLGIPETASFAFVTGCQMAHVTCLAAARHEVLRRVGWDVERDGLAGSPPITVVVGNRRHITIDRALRLLGLGSGATRRVEVDAQARLHPAALQKALEERSGPTIVCAQAGEVNTGAFDDLDAVARFSGEADAWLHVDGAFGLWAAASPELRHLTQGAERADSWATDAHKWLNVPYDSGLAFVAHPNAHRAAMRLTAEYLVAEDGAARDQMDWTPEFSRRARLCCLRRPPLAGAVRRRRPDRALVRSRAAVRDGDRGAAGLRDRERRGPEPGLVPLRRRRSHGGDARVRAGKRRSLDERHDLGRPRGDPPLRGELADDGGGHRAHGGGVRAGWAIVRRERSVTGPGPEGQKSAPMSRPPNVAPTHGRYGRFVSRVRRSCLPDGYFHVSARGVDRATPLFQDADDRNAFLHYLQRTVDRYEWTCHALCVMTTHYHLVLECTRKQLSSGLCWLNGLYAMRFNQRYSRFGHVFAGRFAARAIDDDAYLREACAYVLLNPVKAGLCEGAHEWPWSYSRYGRSA